MGRRQDTFLISSLARSNPRDYSLERGGIAVNPFKISEGAPPFSKTFGYDSRLVIAITICLAALVTFLIMTVFRSTLMTFEDQVGGLSWRFFSDEEEERITIVSIDERSISEIGPWPAAEDCDG